MLYVDIPIIQEAHSDATNDASGDFVFAAPVLAQSQFRPVFESAFAAAISTDQDQVARLEEILLDIVAHLGSRKPRVDIPDSRIARRAQTRVDDDPGAPITCRELAAEAGASRYQLHRAFIDHLGLAPHQYILQKRLALARRLIRSGTALAQVAAATGFYDQSQMNRSFGRQFDKTGRPCEQMRLSTSPLALQYICAPTSFDDFHASNIVTGSHSSVGRITEKDGANAPKEKSSKKTGARRPMDHL